jgi:hypothetical protein
MPYALFFMGCASSRFELLQPAWFRAEDAELEEEDAEEQKFSRRGAEMQRVSRRLSEALGMIPDQRNQPSSL